MKFLRTIILLNSIVLLVLAGHSAFAIGNFSARQVLQQQDTTKKDLSKIKPGAGVKSPVLQDTTKRDPSKAKVGGAKSTVVKEGESKIEYSAVDSTKYSKDKSIIYLYGKARVIYQSFELDADYITYNSKTNTVFASGKKDSKGKYLGKPIFKMEKQGSSVADSLFYNTKSGKGTVFNTFTEQEGGFFSGGQSKRQPDNEIHVKGMTYSTCNLPHPHFGIFITKGIVTDKQIITGPVYLKIEDIPLPLGLPFAFFPKPNKRNSGVIIPNVGDDYTRGFFFRDGGYYLNLNDYWDAKILGTIYTRGSYGVSLTSNYVKRYKYNGSIKLDYGSNRYGLEGTPEYTPRKDYSIQWVHSQNANAHPGTNFGASVNIKTSQYNANTGGGGTYNLNAIAENALQSSISYGRTLADGKVTFAAAARHNQNTRSRSVDVTLPDISLGVQTFSPFDSKNRLGEQKWYQKITVGYSMVASNSISTVDSLLFTKKAIDRLRNGFSHTVPVSVNFTLLKNFNFSAGGTYLEKWQFQSVRQTALRGTLLNGVVQPYKTIIDTVQGFNRSGEYSINMGMSTKIYNTLQFKKLGNLKALRLVMTPNVNFSYRPDFSDPSKGNYKILRYQDGAPVYDDVYKRDKRYSIHDGTLYGGPGEGKNASISFGLDNTLEAKVFSRKDTTGTGMKKIPIIQGLGFNGSYNFLAPSFKLSDLSFSGRSQFTEKFGITYDGSLTPYGVKDTTDINGTRKVLVDRIVIPRLTRFALSFGYSLNAEAFKQRNENLDKTTKKVQQNGMTPEQAAQLAQVSSDPNAFVDFKIPWNFTFSYRFDYSRQRDGTMPTTTSTLNFNGDFNVTPKWKVQFTSGYDFRTSGLSPTSFAIYRDLHCWDMSINWIPIGMYKSYNLTIKVKASILQDLKLSKQQAYYTRF
ncbi:LPS-assembly protein LptD [Pedobacter sp. PAMC26386]|nr:LPS-assembly protein LptD [Pedobacter sp. PAMC26386]